MRGNSRARSTIDSKTFDLRPASLVALSDTDEVTIDDLDITASLAGGTMELDTTRGWRFRGNGTDTGSNYIDFDLAEVFPGCDATSTFVFACEWRVDAFNTAKNSNHGIVVGNYTEGDWLMGGSKNAAGNVRRHWCRGYYDGTQELDESILGAFASPTYFTAIYGFIPFAGKVWNRAINDTSLDYTGLPSSLDAYVHRLGSQVQLTAAQATARSYMRDSSDDILALERARISCFSPAASAAELDASLRRFSVSHFPGIGTGI